MDISESWICCLWIPSLVSIEKQIVLGQKAKILLLRNPRQPGSMSQPKSFKCLLFHNEGSRRRAHRLSIYVHLGDFYGQVLHGLPHPHLPHPKSQLLEDISQITVTFALRLTCLPLSRPSTLPTGLLQNFPDGQPISRFDISQLSSSLLPGLCFIFF